MNTKALAIVASLWVPMVASAASEATVTERQEALSAQLEQILAKTGISISGSFRGEVGASSLGGNYSGATRVDTTDTQGSGSHYQSRTTEPIGYTVVDFDVRARPNTATTARAVFRMYMDHANFFGSPYSPMQTRWLSLDGGFADMAYYHFGDMQVKWSPLVIGTTEPGFLYTPRIFAQEQKQAMDERFISGGARNLQGANIGIRAAVPPLQIDSFDVSFLAAKLLTASPIGSPASVNTARNNFGGDKLTGSPDSMANFDRWALGAKGSVSFLKGLTLGVNFLQTKDLRSTYGTSDTDKQVAFIHYTRRDSLGGKSVAADSSGWVKNGSSKFLVMDSVARKQDLIIQNGHVIAGFFGANVASVIGNQDLIAQLDANVASSSWDVYNGITLDAPKTTADSSKTGATLAKTWKYFGTRTTGFTVANYATKTGMALNGGVTAGWKTSNLVAKAMGGYVMNDSAYRSDLAQTPVFVSALGRIFNTEQDVYLTGGMYKDLLHYNSFDALYHNVHRYMAVDRNEYAKDPYDKLAYSNYVGGAVNPALGSWTAASAKAYKAVKADLDTIAKSKDSGNLDDAKKDLLTSKPFLYMTVLEGSFWDRDLQLVLPTGEASANRVGPKFGLDVDLMQGGLEVKVNGYMLQEAKGTILDSLNQVAAAKADFQQIQAGARVRADRFINGWNMPIEISGSFGLSSAKGGTSLDYTSTAINAGLYVGVIKRLSVLGGYQTIQGKDKATTVDRNQSNLAGGLEFKVMEGAYLLGMYNLITTEFPNASEYNFDQSIWSTKISVSF